MCGIRCMYGIVCVDECAFILEGEEIAELPVRSKRAVLRFQM